MKSPQVENSEFIADKERYSDLQVLESAAGFYIGTLYATSDGYDEPGSRDSDYFEDAPSAQRYLDALLEGRASPDDLRQHPAQKHNPVIMTWGDRDG